MRTSQIQDLVRQYTWGIGHYKGPDPIIHCLEQVLSNWPYTVPVQTVVTPWRTRGCHLHTKVLVKISSAVYPLILSETCEPDVLAFTQNDITYLLDSVIEETEQELSRLVTSGVEITDPLAVMLQETEQWNDYHDTRE